MKNEKFEEFLNNCKIEKNKWIQLLEVDSIILNDGRGIYPNWNHMKFYISNNEIYIQHGYCEPYGARLSMQFAVSSLKNSISFMPSNIVPSTKYYKEFRLPKQGDILISSDGINNILSESLITEAKMYSNNFVISVLNPVKINQNSKFSFYDPVEFKREECIHGTESEGIYMKFIPNFGKLKKNIGTVHEIIKVKNIKEIYLSLSVQNKTYKIC